MRVSMLVSTRLGSQFEGDRQWSREEGLWHRHLLEVVDAFSYFIETKWLVSEPPHVYSRVAPEIAGGVANLERKQRLFFLPADLSHERIRLRRVNDDVVELEPLPLSEVIGMDRMTFTYVLMVPDPILRAIASGHWQSLLLLARELPGTSSSTRRIQDPGKWQSVLGLHFPAQAWVETIVRKIKDPVQFVSEPITAAALRSIAQHLYRWEPLIRSTHDLDDEEALHADMLQVRADVRQLEAWAYELQHGQDAHPQQQVGRDKYSAMVMLRACRCSLLMGTCSRFMEVYHRESRVQSLQNLVVCLRFTILVPKNLSRTMRLNQSFSLFSVVCVRWCSRRVTWYSLAYLQTLRWRQTV